MRILHVTECYSAGVGRAVDAMASILQMDEHHLVVVGSDYEAPLPLFSSVRVDEGNFFGRIRTIRRAVAELEPDVVHVHSSWAGVYSRVLPMTPPVVYQPHSYKFADPECGPVKRAFYRLVERTLLRSTSAVVVVNHHERVLTEGMKPSAQTTFVPNVPTIRRRTDSVAARSFDRKVITTVGRIVGQKDPGYFGRVARLVNKRHPDVVFRWVGDGDPTLKRELIDAGVEVAGWLRGDELVAAFDTAGLYFHPARYEGFPLSVLDAAARGLPVVARSIPAFDGFPLEITTDEHSSADALSRAIEDPLYYRSIAEKSALLLERMTPEAQRESLEGLYRSLIRQPQGAAQR